MDYTRGKTLVAFTQLIRELSEAQLDIMEDDSVRPDIRVKRIIAIHYAIKSIKQVEEQVQTRFDDNSMDVI